MGKTFLDLSVYLVLDPILTEKIGMVKTAELAVEGGATVVQLRAPQWKKRQQFECAVELKKILSAYHVPLIINDSVDVAMAADADGVHVGQKDLPADITRHLIGADKIVGLSVNNTEQMKKVDSNIVDYVGIGPVFSTMTKPDAEAPIGFEGLHKLIALCPVPAVAIGGIKAQHVGSVIRCGAKGIAVVSAICGQKDPKESTHELLRIWKKSNAK